jgi:hypothetical protein
MHKRIKPAQIRFNSKRPHTIPNYEGQDKQLTWTVQWQ